MTDQTTPLPNEENEPKKKGFPWVIILILFIISLIANAFLFYHYYQHTLSPSAKALEKKYKELELSHADLQEIKAGLEEELENARKHLEQTMSENLSFQELNADLSEKVDAQTIRIRQLLNRGGNGDPAALLAAKNQIERLKKENLYYIVRLDSLKAVNADYANKVQGADRAIAKSKELEAKAAALKEKNDSIKNKIENSSLLLVQNLDIKPLRTRRNTEEATFKASKVEKIQIQFTLSGSDIVPYGDKEIVMRLIGVNNEVLTNDNDILTDSDQLITDKKLITFKGEPEKVKFSYKQQADYKRGTYKVEILNKGVLINMGSFILD